MHSRNPCIYALFRALRASLRQSWEVVRRVSDREDSGAGHEGGASGWAPAFEGQRPPFEEGNRLAVTHGAYALLALTPRAGQLAARLWEVLPSKAQAFGAAVEAAAMVGAQVEAAALALEGSTPGDRPALNTALRLWLGRYLQALDALGLTPRSAAELRLHVAVGDQAKAELQRHLEQRQREEGV